ncbi:MAG: FAD-dependent oxidoreductase [Synergistes jonesii]|uniref:oxidoreductase n=1 Tax=Synergistes jonesii TaxID=2754 RepID=UPI002A74BFFF|nr:FAD-dependent oxidoreductase [Synergistes jonesii]MDY2984992.1 FAD-dependent oxidoreductase [Synergistes jonesii]
MKFKHIFTPCKIGSVEIPNRLVVPAMVTNFCNEDGAATEEYIAYHEAKAKGGWGLIITEDYAVCRAGKGYKRVAGLWEDGQIKSHSELPARVHRYGSKIFAQIYHCGRQTIPLSNDGERIVAPSSVQCPKTGSIPCELTLDEIKTIEQQFADTAERAEKCGFDGIEVHAGHGYLISQFLSSYSNKRTDQYGGALINRVRFLKEVIEKIRGRVGDYFPVIVRISAKEFVPGGIDIADVRAVCMMLEEFGVNGLHISVGTYGDNTNVPSMFTSHGWISDFAAEIKKVVSLPVITVGRVNDPIIAEGIVRAGKADFVAMGRSSIADTGMPNKAKAGDLENIRYCIACMQGCTGRLHLDKPIRCLINPMIGGTEYDVPPKAKEIKDIAVVGAGPAGIAAAIGAALVGHKVTLIEKDNQLGGNFRLAGFPLAKGEFENYISWARVELERLGVDVLLNKTADVSMLRALNKDAIVFSTGAIPVVPPIKNIEDDKVAIAEDILGGKVEIKDAKDFVIIGGGLVGIELATFLGFFGKNVTIVEMLPDIAQEATSAIREQTKNHFEKYNVKVMCNTKVNSIEKDSVLAEDVRYGTAIKIMCDRVCLAAGYRKNTSLSDALSDICKNVYVVGDAEAPDNALNAIGNGYKTGISL